MITETPEEFAAENSHDSKTAPIQEEKPTEKIMQPEVAPIFDNSQIKLDPNPVSPPVPQKESVQKVAPEQSLVSSKESASIPPPEQPIVQPQNNTIIQPKPQIAQPNPPQQSIKPVPDHSEIVEMKQVDPTKENSSIGITVALLAISAIILITIGCYLFISKKQPVNPIASQPTISTLKEVKLSLVIPDSSWIKTNLPSNKLKFKYPNTYQSKDCPTLLIDPNQKDCIALSPNDDQDSAITIMRWDKTANNAAASSLKAFGYDSVKSLKDRFRKSSISYSESSVIIDGQIANIIYTGKTVKDRQPYLVVQQTRGGDFYSYLVELATQKNSKKVEETLGKLLASVKYATK